MNQQEELMRGEEEREKRKKDFAAFQRKFLFAVTISIAATFPLCLIIYRCQKSLSHGWVPNKIWQQFIRAVKTAP